MSGGRRGRWGLPLVGAALLVAALGLLPLGSPLAPAPPLAVAAARAAALGGPDAQGAQSVVRIGTLGIIADAPIYIAVDRGYYRDEGIAVVRVLHGASVQIGGDAHVVMRSKHETRSVSGEPVADSLYFLRRRFLFGEQVIEPKDEQRIRVGQHAFIEWQPVAGLVHALKDGYGMSRDLGHERLERHPRAKE